MTTMMNKDDKKCGESCGCSPINDAKKIESKPKEETLEADSSSKENSKTKLDPTHFGDWQIGCRTIDF